MGRPVGTAYRRRFTGLTLLQAQTLVVSKEGKANPLLANLFLNYAFDVWMGRNWSHLPLERYADDISSIAEKNGKRTWCVSK